MKQTNVQHSQLHIYNRFLKKQSKTNDACQM